MNSRMIILILFVVLVAFLALTLYPAYRINGVVNTHIPAVKEKPEDFGLPYQTVDLGSEARRIKAWHISADNPRAGVILVHGYGRPKGSKGHMLAHAKYLYDHGYETLLIDLYSFGESDGKKITFGRDEWQDVKTGYDYLKNQPDLTGKKIGLLGISMGATTVLITAGKEAVGDFVIASVPFATLDSLFRRQTEKERFPRLIVPMVKLALRILIPDHKDALDYASSVRSPVLILKASNDQDNFPEDADKLAITIPNAKLLAFDTPHDIHGSEPQKFESEVLKFLEDTIK